MVLGILAHLMMYGPSSFKFQRMWTRHEDFWRCVSSSWQEVTGGFGLRKLAEKLKHLKRKLQIWNKEVFGWTGRHIKALKEKIEEGDARLQEVYSETVEDDLLASKIELDVWQKREDMRLAQHVKSI